MHVRNGQKNAIDNRRALMDEQEDKGDVASQIEPGLVELEMTCLLGKHQLHEEHNEIN